MTGNVRAQAGLIEWVADAPSLGKLLTGTTQDFKWSLHGRYDPSGWASKDCANHISRIQVEFQSKRMDPAVYKDKSLRALEEVFANTRPVFRHHFFDSSPTAPDWFRRRLAYTRSVAASSIAGFVVGLGDRHTNNILVLEKTGEVVHIDLGIVFDQVGGEGSVCCEGLRDCFNFLALFARPDRQEQWGGLLRQAPPLSP
jgi:ataxia telangiectasia mutated family protein